MHQPSKCDSLDIRFPPIDRDRWNARYADGEYRPPSTPSPFLESALAVVSPGRALVLACGTGRNALFLAEAGFTVEAIDISDEAIRQARVEADRRHLDVQWRVEDLDDAALETAAYDLVTMIRYVDRSLWPRSVDAVAASGWLLMEQHLRTRLDVLGPGDRYRVDRGELLTAFSSLRVVEYREGLEPAEGGQTAALVRLLACKGDPGW